jgi:hypothetical protein
MLSSCLGEPLRRLGKVNHQLARGIMLNSKKLWWENALEAARMERAKNPHERWPGDGPGEAFEMDTRRRR